MERKSNPRVDLTNKTFGYLTPLFYIKGGKWHCQCKCGNELGVDTRNLNSNHTKSCGCLLKEKASKKTYDMIGFENEGIKILERAGSDNQQTALWKCLCKNCNTIFITRGSSIRAGYINSCGCIHSKNEQIISNLLINNDIEFATQYTFSDLIGLNNGRLRFDFAIFIDKKLSHLIEYNGSQHYIEPKGTWAEGYNKIIEHDKIKQQYCEQNNIRLIILKYNQQYSLKDLL
jgi:hypothetical protein